MTINWDNVRHINDNKLSPTTPNSASGRINWDNVKHVSETSEAKPQAKPVEQKTFLPVPMPREKTSSQLRAETLAGAPTFVKPALGLVNRALDAYEQSPVGRFSERAGEAANETAFVQDGLVKTSTGNETADKAAEKVGDFLGYFMPGGAGAPYTAAGNVLTSGVTKTLGRKALTLGAAGAVSGANRGIVQGKDVTETAKMATGEGVLSAVGGGLLHGTEKVVGKVGTKLAENKAVKEAAKGKEALDLVNEAYAGAKIEKVSAGIHPKLQQTKNTIPLKSPTVPENTVPNINTLNKLPKASTGTKERQFAQNVRDSNIATGEIKANLDKNQLNYEPITNKETFDKATETVKKNADEALEIFNSPSKGVSADDVALGEALITKAIKEGNSGEANRLIADLAEKLTTAGQAVQAASIFKRLTPEGMLLYAQRTVNSANKDLADMSWFERMGKKAQKIALTSEDSQFILDKMKEAQGLSDGREKDVAIAQVMQLIADKVPSTLSEKVKGLQRISLLLNPKTMVRNLGGNALFSGLDNLSNAIATPIDIAASKITGKRTTTLPSLKGQFKSGIEGAKYALEDAKLGIDTSTGTQFELPNKRIFDNKALNKLDEATKLGLQLGDRPFYKAAYDDVLRQQMKLAKVSEPTQEMIEQAHKIAQQRTYQDVNALTNAFKQAQVALNNASEYVGLGNSKFGLGNIVVPFVKTPANILARAVEYSPLGVTKALREATKIGKGTFDQKAFIDSIARSVTGTALIMVGYDLAKGGTITGSGNKDKDVAAFERSLGKSDYAFKVGDNYYTYDWAQPASFGLAIGADIYLSGKDRKEAENVVFNAVKSGGETLLKQTVMQGIQRFMGGYSPIDNLATTAVNAPTQFVPTLGKQITQLTDPLQRSSYSPSTIGTGANLIKSKIPGASKTLQPKVDTFGNDMLNYQGKNNLINIFINPGSATEFKPNKVQSEILRVYESTGDKDIFPKVAPKYFTEKGVRYDLTPEEITTFQRTMGKKTEARMSESMGYKEYDLYPDKIKAKALARAIDLSYEEAKLEVLGKRKAGG